MDATNLEGVIGDADARRISAAVARLRDELDAGTYLERAFVEVLRDASAEEALALHRILDLPTERAELTAERRRAAGARFLEGSPEDQDAALLEFIPELAGDDEDGEEYELLS
jgi:hypothetical protein